jgi:trehalose/maltose transport system substrate-binding protein
MLVRFLCSRDEQIRRCRKPTEAPTLTQLYDEPELLASNPHFPRVLEIFRKGIALRPSTSAGKMYPEVSRAYSEAVHAVLTGKKSAAQAAEELQNELQRMLKIPTVRTNADPHQKAAAQR